MTVDHSITAAARSGAVRTRQGFHWLRDVLLQISRIGVVVLTIVLLLMPLIGPFHFVIGILIALLAIPIAIVGFTLLNIYAEVLLGALLGGVLGGIWPGTPFLPTAVAGAAIGALVVPMAFFFDVTRIDRGALVGGTIGGGVTVLFYSSVPVETAVAVVLLGAMICSEP